MNNLKMFKALGLFLSGALTGGAAVYLYFVPKERKRADEEVNSVKEAFSRNESLHKNTVDKLSKMDITDWKDEKKANINSDSEKNIIGVNSCDEYAEMNKDFRKDYHKMAKKYTYDTDGDNLVADYPNAEIISSDDYGDKEEYATMTLYYYSNGILTDTDDADMGEVELVIGLEALEHFGDEEEDVVYVRNHDRRIDFEVISVDKEMDNYE